MNQPFSSVYTTCTPWLEHSTLHCLSRVSGKMDESFVENFQQTAVKNMR
jgi:hypothetical protein